MIRNLILLLVIPLTGLSQSNSDYDIYSELINNKFLDWKINTDTLSHVVITNTLTKFGEKSTVIEYLDDMIANENRSIYNFIHFYDKPVDILNNVEFKHLLNDFKSRLTLETELKADSFKLKMPVEIVNKQRVERIFARKIIKDWDKPWRKFYKEFHTNLGFFEFSKVAYSENFAIVYIVHKSNPLNGSGELEIFLKENGIWRKLANYGLWFN